MTRPETRALAMAAVVATLGMSVAPSAAADPPPAPDDRFLPAPADPAPASPTRQVVSCSLPTWRAGADPGQAHLPIDDAVLQQIRQLTTGTGQTVAVIDTGVSQHQQLRDVVGGGDYISTGDGTHDCDGHGTIVAGIIAAQPDPSGDNGFVGLAPDVRLVSIRQSTSKFGERGISSTMPGLGDVDTMAMAVRTAADLGATVINISVVACERGGALGDRALGAAVAYAVEVKDAVVVAAAGNADPNWNCQQNPGNPAGGQPVPNWDDIRSSVSPGRYDDYVLTVGSVGPDGAASPFTLAGPWVDVAAPGEAVVSLDPDGEGIVDTTAASDGAETFHGTSYAAPYVSAVAALVRTRFPQLSATEVMRRIEDTAQAGPSGWDPFIGHGVVDPLAAISVELPATATPPTTSSVAIPVDTPTRDASERRTALTGAALCLTALIAFFGLRRASARLVGFVADRNSGPDPDGVIRDQRVRPAQFRTARQQPQHR